MYYFVTSWLDKYHQFYISVEQTTVIFDTAEMCRMTYSDYMKQVKEVINNV